MTDTSFKSPLLITCVGVDHDLELLPHFLEHYLRLGVLAECILPILNTLDANSPRLSRARTLLSNYGVAPAEIWVAPYTSEVMWSKRREIQRLRATPTDWVLSADADEFHDFPEPLPDFLRRCDRLQVDTVQGVFIDRLDIDGRLAPVQETPDLMTQFPVEADVIWSLGGRGEHHNRFGTVKLMAIKGRILPNRGGHDPQPGQLPSYLYNHPLGRFPGIERPDFRFRIPTRVHHFHWTEKLPQMLRARLSTPGVNEAGAEYGRKQLAHIEKFGGIKVDDVSIAPRRDRSLWHGELRRMRREGRLRAILAPLADRADEIRSRMSA